MLEDTNKKDLMENTTYVKNEKIKKQIIKFNRSKRFCFVLAIIICLGIIIGSYFLLPVSNVFSIAVSGNVYLQDKDIIKQSGITNETKFLLVNPIKVKEKILENKIIKDCEVKLSDNKLISIEVKENKIIGYMFIENECVLVLENNIRIPLDNENLYLINYVPLLEGFSNEDIILIGKNLKNIDYKIINEISEMHNYKDLKYQNVQIIMRDGNNIFASVYGLNILNSYYNIESSYASDEKHCIYFEDISQNAYVSACPWQEPIETVDDVVDE